MYKGCGENDVGNKGILVFWCLKLVIKISYFLLYMLIFFKGNCWNIILILKLLIFLSFSNLRDKLLELK